MTSTEATGATTGTTRPNQFRAPGPARRVRLPWLAAAAGAALLATMVVLWGFSRAADRREVVIVTAPVDAGSAIPLDALGTTFVAVDSSATKLFDAGQATQLVGQVAATDLAPGDLLGPSMIAELPEQPAGWQQVGALLPASHFPETLRVGDRMRAVPRDESNATGHEVLVVQADPGGDGSVLAVLAAPPEVSATVAQWSATSNLVLVRIGQ